MKSARTIAGVAVIAGLAFGVTLFHASAHNTAAKNSSSSVASAVSSHPSASGDAILEALLTELDRSKAQLKMDQVQAPYYIEYRVSDVDDYDAEAAFGAIRESQRVHLRILRVVVRVGDYRQDSYFGQGMGETNILPLDNDPIALRHQIWLSTDEAYKAAGQALAEKQAEMKRFTPDPNPVADFSKEPVLTAVEPTVSLALDEAAWRKNLEDVTNLYRQYPDVQSVSASARFTAMNEYFVDSEGTVTRNGKTTYNLVFNSSAQADDGMRLSRNPYWMVARAEELPSHDKFIADAKQALDTVVALRKAPIVEEEYRGPLLFAPDAATDVIASLVGSNVIGRKPQLGRPNRTVGQFATSYKFRVLPTFLSIIDDPTLKDFEGHSLVGSYDVDEEGVKAQTVSVIENGILDNYLIGRQPLRDFPVSNGHGRAAPGALPSPSLGVLLVKSGEAESAEALKKKMMDMVSQQGNPYGYRVDTLGPGNSPRLLYRVYADGHEQLVRGAVFNELDVRALRSDLIAVGNDPLVSNRTGGVPTTVICPSLLFDELEVKRADMSKDKLPDYPAPPLKN
ncbi:MAG TPA: metallopeptidase TldD-related protein [Candidatus Methylomirabilis sp.]|nr:metallopeptidase TldD-related protein [Candidatus Methylomirabilis sp.]